MPPARIAKGEEYELPGCHFGAPEGKEFDEWSVVVGKEPAVKRIPSETVTANDNIKVIGKRPLI